MCVSVEKYNRSSKWLELTTVSQLSFHDSRTARVKIEKDVVWFDVLYHQNSAQPNFVEKKRIMLPVCAIPFACKDSNADKMLRAMNFMSCLEILASKFLPRSKISKHQTRGALALEKEFLCHSR